MVVVIYESKDGFKVRWKYSEVGTLAKNIQAAVEKYVILEPDYDELKSMAEAVYKWMDSKGGAWNIGYPVYANDNYFAEIKKIVKNLCNTKEKRMKTKRSRKMLFESINKKFEKEYWNYYSDVCSS